jgi:hypothetical protein
MTVAGLASIVLGVALAAALPAQTPPARPPAGTQASTSTAAKVDHRYRFRLLGVYDDASGEPVEGVEVSDMLSGTSALTTKTGTVSLIFLPDGGSFVRLRKVGYEMQTLMAAISPADTAPITVTLRKVTTLAKVTVRDSAPTYISPRLQGAVERMKSHAGGYFIDEAEMRKWDNSTLGNAIIAHMPGLMSITGPRGGMALVSTRQMCKTAFGCSRQSNCYVTVYLDGVRSTVLPDFNRLSPEDYALAEFYPGGASVPAEYGGTDSPCGALLLWTREQ